LRARSSESKVPWVLMRFAFYGHCGDRIVEERGGNLLEVLGELQFYFLDKLVKWIYGAMCRLLAGKVERVGGEHWLVEGSPIYATPTPGAASGSIMRSTVATASPAHTAM